MLRRSKFATHSARAALALGIMIGTPQIALAQTPSQDAPAAEADDATVTGDDIIVTAQKRAERVVDVPATLTVLSSESLDRGGGTSNLELTYQTPGVKMDRIGVNTVPAIRGVTSLISTPGLDANVATYVDGVYSSAAGTVLDLPDIENILILKGPQGTLFGRNATGGAIQIVTRKPEYDFNGTASFSYGRFNEVIAKGFVTGPIVPDVIAFSLSGSYQRDDGYLHDIVNDRRTGALRSHMIRGKLLVEPTDNFSMTLTGYYSRREDPKLQQGTVIDDVTQANAQPGSIYSTKPYEVASNLPAISTSRLWGVSFDSRLNLDIGDFSLIAAYDDQSLAARNPGYAASVPAGGYFFLVDQDEKKTSVELNFASKQMGPVNFISGVYYYNNIGAYDPLQIVVDVPTRVVSIFGYQETTAFAAFGEVNVSPIDRLNITAGIRYSHEARQIDGNGCICNQQTPNYPLTDFGHVSFNSWTPRFAVRYEIADRTNIYASYSKGFKSGGYNTSSTFGSAAPLTPVRPEKIDAYEVGVKSASSRLNLNLAGFFYDYTDQQVNAFIPGPGGTTIASINNAASSHIYGVEFEGNYKVTDELTINAGASYTHARFQSYPDAVVVVPNPVTDAFGRPIGNVNQQRDAGGNRLPKTPEWTFLVGARYEKEIGNGRLTLRGDFYHSSSLFFDAANIYGQDAYNNLDASIAWTFPGDQITASIWGKNLTDEVRALGSFIAAPSTAYYWAAPRTYGVALAFKF